MTDEEIQAEIEAHQQANRGAVAALLARLGPNLSNTVTKDTDGKVIRAVVSDDAGNVGDSIG